MKTMKTIKKILTKKNSHLALFLLLVFVLFSFAPSVHADILIGTVNTTASSDGKSETISGTASGYTPGMLLTVECSGPSGYKHTYSAHISSGAFSATCLSLTPGGVTYDYAIYDASAFPLIAGEFTTGGSSGGSGGSTAPNTTQSTVYQDTSCTTADVDGYITGDYNAPVVLKYRPSTAIEDKSVPVTVHPKVSSDAPGELFTATMTGLASGVTYNYWLHDSTGGAGLSFGASSFTFNPTSGGCGGTSGGTANVKSTVQSDKSVVISGNVGQSATNTVNILYGTNKDAYSGMASDNVASDKSFSVTIGPLSDGTYYFVVRDRDGTTLPGTTDSSFVVGAGGTTPPPGPGGDPTITDATATVSPADTSADIFVTMPSSYKQMTAHVYYSTETSYGGAGTGSMYVLNNGISFNGTITNLKAGTTYYYDVFPTDDTKAPPLTASQGSFTTTDNGTKTPPKPSGLGDLSGLSSIRYTPGYMVYVSVSNVTQTTAVVHGQRLKRNIQLNLTNKVVPKIKIVDISDGTDFSFTPNKILADGTFSDSIKDLDPAHTYNIVAISPTDPLTGYTRIQKFRTLPIILLPNLSQISEKSATISVEGTAGIKTLTLQYGKSKDSLKDEQEMKKSSGRSYFGTLDNLTANTKYFYRIKIVSTDKKGTESYSMIGMFITGEAPPVAGKIQTIKGDASSRSLPTFSGGIVPCSGVDETGTITTCKFDHLIKLFSNVINFLMFYIGFIILTSAGNTEKITMAKKLLSLVVTGVLVTFCAWILVKTVLVGLGYDSSYFPTFY
jgi:hypothetical protein